MKINSPIININSISEDGTISIKNEKSYLFSIQGQNFWSYDRNTQEEYIKSIHNIFSSLKLGYFKIFKIKYRSDLEENKAKLKEKATFIVEDFNSKKRTKQEKVILDNKLKYYQNVLNDIETIENNNSEFINKYFLMVQLNNKMNIELLEREVRDTFLSGHIRVERIKNQKEIEEVFMYLSKQPFNEEVKFKEEKDYIQINDKYLWCFRINDFETILEDDFLFNYLFYNSAGNETIDCNFMIDYSKISEEEKVKLLDKISRILRFKMSETKKDTEASAISIEQESLENLIEENTKYKLSFYDCDFLGLVSANNLEELRTIKTKIINEAKKKGVFINENKYQQAELYKHFTLQTIVNVKNSVHTFSSYNIARSWALLSNYFNDKNHLILGRNRSDGGVLFFDDMVKNKKRLSSSMFFVGKTGSGKTTAIKKIINYHSAQNDSIFLIDPNNDYTKLTLHNGGTVLDMSDVQNFRMNILEIKQELQQDPNTQKIIKTPLDQIINYKIKFLKGLFKLIDSQLEQIHFELIERLIKWVFKQKGYYEKGAKLEKLDQIQISDLIQVLKVINLQALSDFDFSFYTEEHRQRVLRFLHHNFSPNAEFEFFNTLDTFNVDNSIVSYNMQQLLAKTGGIPTKETNILFYILIYQISFSVIENLKYNLNKYGMENQKKWRNIVIVVDEMHKFLGGAAGVLLVDFLFDLIKTLRKYWGMLIIGTQSFKDFTLNKELENKTKQLLEQTQYKFILKVNKEDLESFNNTLSGDSKLLDWEQNYINNAEQGEALFMCDETERYPISFLYNNYEEDMFFTQITNSK